MTTTLSLSRRRELGRLEATGVRRARSGAERDEAGHDDSEAGMQGDVLVLNIKAAMSQYKPQTAQVAAASRVPPVARRRRSRW